MAKAKSAKAKKNGKAAAVEKREVHTLGWRDCDLPPGIGFRTQKHGDDPVKAADIRVSGIELTKAEVNTLANDKYADRTLWASGGRGKPERPAVGSFAPRRIREPIETARVAIKVGGEEIKLGVCRLKAIDIEPKVGGVAEMGCMIQATPTIDKRIPPLIAATGKARIHIEYEHNAEQLEADVDTDQPKKGDPDAEKFESDAKAQIDAWRNGTPSGGEDAPAAETH